MNIFEASVKCNDLKGSATGVDMRHVFLVLLILVLSGCATHKSPLQLDDKFIFVTEDEESIFQAAYDSMLEGRKESPVADLNGPIRGYSLTQKWALDYWTSMIRVFPAEGRMKTGEIVRGYYPEVSGEGTLIIRGPSMDKRIYDAALVKFEKVARKVSVVDIKRGHYYKERDAFRLHEQASLRDGGTIKIEAAGFDKTNGNSIEDRLKELESLRSKNLIDDDEYKDARNQILGDI